MNKPVVVKIGGATFGKHDPILEDIVALQKKGQQLVVIHGGGNVVTEWLKKQGIPTTFIRGERVTDKPALEMVAAVLAGLMNKQIVGTINLLGGKAVGLSGVDGAMIQGRVSNPELGYVGATVRVDTAALLALLDTGFIPVVAPLSLFAEDRPAGEPVMLNINGDPLAGDIAAALGAEKLIFLTDVKGVNDADGRLISLLNRAEAGRLIEQGIVNGGMIPKITGALKVAAISGTAYIVDGRQPGALIDAVEKGIAGTTIS